MDKSNKLELPVSGHFIRGIVVSNNVSAFNRKDGSGVTVRISYELALQPGIATLERFATPSEEPGIKLDGLTVLEFPKLKEFQAITVKAIRLRSDKDRTVVTAWEIV